MKPIKPGVPDLTRDGFGRDLTPEQQAVNANGWGLIVNFAPPESLPYYHSLDARAANRAVTG